MDERPISITIISWVLIILASISLLDFIYLLGELEESEIRILMDSNASAIWIQGFLIYAGMIIPLISGIAILRGFNWGRVLYLLWNIIIGSLNLLVSAVWILALPGLIVFATFTFFLFHPEVKDYFKSTRVLDARGDN
ncbi:DUF2593 family protein [Halonatronum saccharophilum]|uniref:DUF2593 family protein n=1 Tax=Halonatronum saccharophilum TaxID=150060 RepID=UPI0004820F74|nr:DUF2593 family protein [Halonatronum saccharophilum]